MDPSIQAKNEELGLIIKKKITCYLVDFIVQKGVK